MDLYTKLNDSNVSIQDVLPDALTIVTSNTNDGDSAITEITDSVASKNYFLLKSQRVNKLKKDTDGQWDKSRKCAENIIG